MKKMSVTNHEPAKKSQSIAQGRKIECDEAPKVLASPLQQHGCMKFHFKNCFV